MLFPPSQGARFYWGPWCSRGQWEQATGSLACSFCEGAVSLFILWGESRDVSRSWTGGRWFAYPLGDVVCRGHVQFPAFFLGSSKVVVGFLGLFLYLLSRVFPNCTCMQLFLVPCSSIVFCWSRRGMSRGSSQLRDPTSISLAGRFFTVEPPGKPLDRCTQLDTPYSLTAVGVVSINFIGVLPSCQPLVSGGTPFPGFKNLVSRVYLWRDCSFLCIFSGSWYSTLRA